MVPAAAARVFVFTSSNTKMAKASSAHKAMRREGIMDLQNQTSFNLRQEGYNVALDEFRDLLTEAANALFEGKPYEFRVYPQSFSVFREGPKGARELAIRLQPHGRGIELVKTLMRRVPTVAANSVVFSGKGKALAELERIINLKKEVV